MSASSTIEWTDATWSPVTGCDQVSSGCDHCYAMTLAKRLKAMGSPKYQNDGDPRTSGPGFGVTVHPDALRLPFTWKTPKRIFVNSMSDLFHDDVPASFIAEVFAVMAATPQHVYQVLTKRHSRMCSLIGGPIDGPQALLEATCSEETAQTLYDAFWPLPNVWLGVSVEDQRWAQIRIPKLLETSASVRFLSCEPLLGPVDLRNLEIRDNKLIDCLGGDVKTADGVVYSCTPSVVDWVIVGGESGPGARPMFPHWVRDLRDQCSTAHAAYFFKQWGAWAPTGSWSIGGVNERAMNVGPAATRLDRPGHRERIERVGKKKAGRELDGRTWDEMPETLTAVTL